MSDRDIPRDPRNGQFHLFLWGGAAQKAGMEGDFWFAAADVRQAVIGMLELNADMPLFYQTHDGPEAHLRTVCDAIFVYKDWVYPITYDFGIGYPEEGARYMFEDGNYACDCNRSNIIRRTYPDFPEMGCGGEIFLRAFTTRLVNILEEACVDVS